MKQKDSRILRKRKRRIARRLARGTWREQRSALLRMEFRRFLMGLVRVPAQIVQTGRRPVYRILGYT